LKSINGNSAVASRSATTVVGGSVLVRMAGKITRARGFVNQTMKSAG
jgi:hypothetical protein